MGNQQSINKVHRWHNILFEHATEAIIRFNNDHEILEVNKEFEELFQFSEKELIGREIDEVLNSAHPNAANKQLTQALLNGKAIREKGVRYDRYGNPIHCLVRGIPVLINGEFVGGYAMYVDISDQHDIRNKLERSKKKYSRLVHELSEGLILHNQNEEFIFVNEAAEKIFEVPPGELVGRSIKEFVSEAEYKKVKQFTQRRLNEKTDEYYIQIKTYKGNEKIIKVKATPIYFEGEQLQIYALMQDVTAMVQSKLKLRKSEKKFRSIFHSMNEGIIMCELIYKNDHPVDIMVVDTNEKLHALFDVTNVKDDLIQAIEEVNMGFKKFLSKANKLITEKKDYKKEFYLKHLDRYFDVFVFNIDRSRFGISIRDITKEKKNELKIKHMSYHDNLTGLKNRHYLEDHLDYYNQPENLPLGIIVGDANGLKLINDIYGHLSGDQLLLKITEIIQHYCSDQEEVIRWGGDEFLIMSLNSSQEQIKALHHKISNAFEKEFYKSIPISISLGYSIKLNDKKDIYETITIAEDYMYQNKLLESRSIKNKLLNRMINELTKKSKETTEHALRLERHSRAIGKLLKLDALELDKLKMLSYLHDIGKIIIPRELLNKPGKLSTQEWQKIKKHSEAGYKILISSEEFSNIAQYVLHHHEWYDGNGYPAGLAGDEIPLLSRIIAVVDAFDAMTHRRTYAEKKTLEEATLELQQFSGTQFDPTIVDLFINKVL